MDRVACIILNYNSGKLSRNLAETLARFDSVAYVVVVDNNSFDDSKLLFSSLCEENSKIRVLLNDNNIGYAKGNNIGAVYAITELKCDYVVIVNPDVVFSENYIIEVRNLMRQRPEIAVASAIAHDADDKISYCSYWRLPTFTDYIRKFFPILEKRYQYRKLLEQKSIHDNYVITEAVSGACFMANKEVFQQMGGVDENTFLYCEESILGSKLKDNGRKEAVVFTAFYNHNHVYKKENAEHRIKHYTIMLASRRYYLSKIQKNTKVKLAIYDVLAKIAIVSRSLLWKVITK